MIGHTVVDGEEHRCTQAYVWDTNPSHTVHFIDQAGQETILPDPEMRLVDVEHFCCGQTGTGDGDVIFVGGSKVDDAPPGIKDTSLFKHDTLSWQAVDDMNHGRWYATVVPLSDGSFFAVAGVDKDLNYADVPERLSLINPVWTDVAAKRLDDFGQPVDFDSDNYPFMFAIHDPTSMHVFWAGKRRRNETTNEGLRSHVLSFFDLLYRPAGDHIPSEGSGAVLWIPSTAGTIPKKGKVIKCGGNGTKELVPGTLNTYRYPASPKTWEYDQDATTPDWLQKQDMSLAATDCNMVFLPDGKVLVVGGSKYDHGYTEEHSIDANAVRTTQVYDPVAGTWSLAADMPSPDRRWYHSTACLLPDGSILSAGSNDEENGRIYYPSYYPSTRPGVQAVDTSAHYGQTLSVTLTGTPTIEKVTLIRLNATTHGFDQGQRFINCNFTRNGSSVTVTGPASGGVAPPGYYMISSSTTASRRMLATSRWARKEPL
jgi:hypothetical protein